MSANYNIDDLELRQIILEDKTLKKEDKEIFLSYATLYESDLKNNLDLDSIDLNEKYATGNPRSWQRFLQHPSVKKYIEGFLDERAAKAADRRLSDEGMKTHEALKVKAALDAKGSGMDNSNIVVMFLPQKEYV